MLACLFIYLRYDYLLLMVMLRNIRHPVYLFCYSALVKSRVDEFYNDQDRDIFAVFVNVVVNMSGVRKKINRSAVFKQRTKNDDNAELSKSVVISARKSGRLNLSSRGLSTGTCTETIYAYVSK